MKKNQITNLSLLFITLLSFSTSSNAQHWSMTNVAGDGENAEADGFIEGEGALDTPIGRPTALAMDPDNNLYFAVPGYGAPSNSGIFRINNSDNTINHAYEHIEGITGIVIDSEGNIYYCRGGNSVGDLVVPEYIYKIDPDGDTWEVAGNGLNEAPPITTSSADTYMGNAATIKLGPNEEYLYYCAPYLGVTSDGLPWINYVQRINLAAGTTERFVGAGGGDGLSSVANGDDAITADIAMGYGMAWDSKGNFYFSTYDNQIKKIIEGNIYHVAGVGGDGAYSGDNGPAADAQFDLSTSGFHITDGDMLVICDTKNNRIRKFQLSTTTEADGEITTFCGTGVDEASGDDEQDLYNGFFRLAIKSNIEPYDLLMRDEEIYFSDKDYRIRKAYICKNPEVTNHSFSSDIICIGDNITINTDADLGDAISWEWYEGADACDGEKLPGESNNSLTISNVQEAGVYYVIGTGGCTNDAECYQIEFNLTCKEFFNAITPNGDGLNDFVDMPALGNYPTNTVTFYNRWGDILEVIENYDNGTTVWTGTNGNGDPVDSGTYYFTAESGGELIISGWVQVIREQ